MARVIATVVAYDRKLDLLACLNGIADQTSPVDEILVVDNGSTDGTEEAVEGSEVAKRLPLSYARIPRNVGAVGGYNVALQHALDRAPEWIWVLACDNVPAPDALETMLSSEPARVSTTAAICPAIVGRDGEFQGDYSGGRYRRRFAFRLSARQLEHAQVRIDHASFMGMLVRSSALKSVGLLKSEFFLSADDLEWFLRLRDRWHVWLVPRARVVHTDEAPFGVGRLGRLRRALQPVPDAEIWKNIYCFRNMCWIRRRYDDEGKASFAFNLGKQWFRTLLVDPHRFRRARLFLDYGLAGRRGEFRHCPPHLWAEHLRHRDARRRLAESSSPLDPADTAAAGTPRRISPQLADLPG